MVKIIPIKNLHFKLLRNLGTSSPLTSKVSPPIFGPSFSYENNKGILSGSPKQERRPFVAAFVKKRNKDIVLRMRHVLLYIFKSTLILMR